MRRLRLTRALFAGLALALGLVAAMAAGFVRDARPLDARAGELAVLVALAAFIAGALALVLTDRLAPNARPAWRAATAALAVIALGGPGLIGLYGLHFGVNAYGEIDLGDSLGWVHFAYAAAQGMIYFAIFGFRLMAPWGIIAVAVVALIAAPRPTTAPA